MKIFNRFQLVNVRSKCGRKVETIHRLVQRVVAPYILCTHYHLVPNLTAFERWKMAARFSYKRKVDGSALWVGIGIFIRFCLNICTTFITGVPSIQERFDRIKLALRIIMDNFFGNEERRTIISHAAFLELHIQCEMRFVDSWNTLHTDYWIYYNSHLLFTIWGYAIWFTLWITYPPPIHTIHTRYSVSVSFRVPIPFDGLWIFEY